MKLSFKLLLTCSLATSFMFADNKTPTPKEAMSTTPLAYVNTHEIITLDPNLLSGASDQWRDEYNKLKQLMEPVEKEIEELASKVERAKAEFEALQDPNQAPLVSQETMVQKQKDLYSIYGEWQKRAQESSQFAQDRLKNVQSQIQPKILQAIQDVAKEGSYQLVVDGMVVLAAPGAENVTSKVLTKINRDYALEKAKKINSEKLLEPTKPSAR